MQKELKDVVCGMKISSDSKFNLSYKGTSYYFCSDSCQHKFTADTKAYVQEEKISAECETCKPFFTEHMPHMHEESKDKKITTNAVYTCPMHSEIQQKGPGNCPICGMALEPMVASLEEEENEELSDMTRRFKVSTVLALPVFILAMVADLAPSWLPAWLSMSMVQWIEFALATPVVLWGGWPFFVRGVQLRKNMEPQYVHSYCFRCRCCLALQYGRFTFS